MKRKIGWILAIVALLAGIAVIAYPFVSQWIYSMQVQQLVQSFTQDVQDTPENGTLLDELYTDLQQKNEELYANGQSTLKDPFSYEEPGVDLTQYGLKDNIIGYVSIPKINETLPIYLGANTQNMSKGAVHLTQTSYPIGGSNTNAVLAAHRNYYKGNLFKNIDYLQPGDEVLVHNFKETITYKVTFTLIIQPDEIDKILIQPGNDMLTLLSCHPRGQNTQRIVVYCQRVA